MELGTNVPLNSQTAGVINYEEDIDFFVFRTAGRGEYRIATEGRATPSAHSTRRTGALSTPTTTAARVQTVKFLSASMRRPSTR